ncbi:hypothetical protein SAMN05428988_0017 [Chitinophaga sp. YR573]|uniref:hypothetical protein n=1 Tax=Chitinophaga sp. YR573 TaxID=1881040 RepID=UPI0008B14033|nr:hypothetical protein [Chitinophaga sp. YR573]SEV87606.1 hypothetical protein SAMN05428988_0017 [Chitinophaga sp. YR573]
MRIISCLLFSISLTFFTGRTLAQTPSNSWAVVPVTADGMLNEWKTPLRYFDDRTHLAYEISNDLTNLYVAVSTMDEATQVSIMRTGISLGVNIKGKKKINTAVTYPLIDGKVLFAQRRHSGDGRPSSQMPEDVYDQLRPHMGNAGVKGIIGVEDGTIDVTQHRTGIIAALSFGNDTLNVEFVIPLSKLGLTPDYTKEVAYSITVNEDVPGGMGNNNRGPRMGGVGLGVGMGGGSMGGVGGGFGVNLGSFGGRRGMDGGGRNKDNTVRVKQLLAKQEKM